MAAKVKLNLDPSEKLEVQQEVEIPTPSGKPLKITFDFIYRNRIDVATLIDEHAERGRKAVEAAIAQKQTADGGEALTGAEFERELAKRDVKTIQDLATGWNIENEWGDSELLNLCIKYPGAGRAIAEKYRQCMVEGRLGN